MRAMKDSGIEWIGEIPVSWRVKRGKSLFTQRLSKGNEDETLLAATQKYGMYPQSLLEGVVKVKEETDMQAFKTVHTNDYVISLRSFQGGFELSDYEGVCSPAYQVFYNRPNIDYRFFKYLFKSDGFISKMNSLTVGIREGKNIQFSDFANTIIPIPPISDQHHISKGLDAKCAQIDTIIEKQQKVIEKLKAYKQSDITETVTKGLDPTVPMKDSRVKWIGKIPENWSVIRLKYLLTQIIDCPHETPSYCTEGEYYVIRTADQDLGFLRSDETMYRLDENEYFDRIRRMSLEKDDIVYGREGERWGLACLVPESNKYCLGQRMMQFRCNRSAFLPSFAVWALNSENVYLQGSVDTFGSTAPHVNISTMRNYAIPVPPLKEQCAIAYYINKKVNKIENQIQKRSTIVENLINYKKSLIYEAVTGKMEV